MLSEVFFNTLSLNTGNVMNEIKKHIRKYLAESEDRLLEIMEREVLQTTHGQAPGKPEWRDMVRERLEVIEEVVTDNYMEAKVGLDKNI